MPHAYNLSTQENGELKGQLGLSSMILSKL